MKAGEADISFLPSTGGFRNEDLGSLLALFQTIKLDEPESESPIWVNWEYLERKLGLPREKVERLMHEARQCGLMERLTIDYDHERWLRHSRKKGCLVVMTCVEPADLDREINEVADAYCDAIDKLVKMPAPLGLLGEGDTLEQVFVVPNGHLNARSGPGIDWQRALVVLDSLPPALEQRGYQAALNSYGYEKLIRLAINAHKLGYVLRVV